jgi:hypothetical protein
LDLGASQFLVVARQIVSVGLHADLTREQRGVKNAGE